ncbi:hypothetical protein [Actinomadura sp. 9N215]|uniref:hypothetical protein n=1 Tax=Actinomadura sp. 9N215 TaxID=3375150 RepID=UPI00379D7A11
MFSIRSAIPIDDLVPKALLRRTNSPSCGNGSSLDRDDTPPGGVAPRDGRAR